MNRARTDDSTHPVRRRRWCAQRLEGGAVCAATAADYGAIARAAADPILRPDVEYCTWLSHRCTFRALLVEHHTEVPALRLGEVFADASGMSESSIAQIPPGALDKTSPQKLVDAIVAARNSARGRLHLLSLDARDQWQDLESELDSVQSRIEYEGSRIRPSAAGKVRELIQSVAEFLSKHATTSTLAVAAHSPN